uniref:Uncharacterized protein n=1 Tax=Varanus komodoensis TaxID=61221 RepID=A0A8D2Q8Q8_VARKO
METGKNVVPAENWAGVPSREDPVSFPSEPPLGGTMSMDPALVTAFVPSRLPPAVSRDIEQRLEETEDRGTARRRVLAFLPPRECTVLENMFLRKSWLEETVKKQANK